MTLRKLSVTSAGWVNNVTHHVSPNYVQNMSVPSGVNGVVFHTMVGNLPGTDQEFENRAAQVSAHFGIGQNGEIIQWVDIKGGTAWAEAAGNEHWYSIENADNGDPNNPMTEAQLESFASLLELLSRVGNFPLQITNSTSGQGLGVHYMGGAAWGGHTCPDEPPNHIRSRQRQTIIDLAKKIRGGVVIPTVVVKYWNTKGQDSLKGLAANSLKNEPSTVIRLTAQHSAHAVLPQSFADYLNGIFKSDTEKVPKGTALWLGDRWFNASGNQTLYGIGLDKTVNMHPAAILQGSAQHNGWVFSGPLSNYVNTVINRSSVKVPKGIVLYYEV